MRIVCSLPLFKLLSVGFLVQFLGLTSFAQASSLTTLASRSTVSPIAFETSFIPPGDGEPPDTQGAGTRSNGRCAGDTQAIQPLMPDRNYGLTLEERPAIFVKLPATSARQAVLVFQDEAGTTYERAFLPLPEAAGKTEQIVQFRLPEDKAPLAIGKNYRWWLVMMCGETVQPDDPVFTGWVQRVERTTAIRQALAQQDTLQQLRWYGDRGYWYDLLGVLFEAEKTSPNLFQHFLEQNLAAE